VIALLFDSHATVMNSEPVEAADGADLMLKLKLVTFFYNNRFTMDTAHGLSLWTGTPPADTARAAEALVSEGILVKRGPEDAAVYALARGAAVRQRVATLLQSS